MTMRVSVRIPMTMRESVRVREVCCGPDTWHWYCPASDTPTSRTISTNSSPRVTSTLYLSNDDIKKNQITCTEAGILINNYLFIAGILSTAYAGLGICTLFCFFCSFERATRANCSGRSFKKSEKSESLWFKSEKLKLKLKQILITLFLFAFKKKRAYSITLFKKATRANRSGRSFKKVKRAIHFRRSLQKEQTERFALLKRAK